MRRADTTGISLDRGRNAYDRENKSVLLHAMPTRYPTRVWELWIRDASQETGEAVPRDR